MCTGDGSLGRILHTTFREFHFHAVGRQRGMLADRAETVRSLMGRPDYGTPTTTPTRPRTARTHLRATTCKICRTSHTYGKSSLRPRTIVHTHKQTLPHSKSGGAKAPCRFEPDLRYC
jgi:hypothetical protein